MFTEEVLGAAELAKKKVSFLRNNPAGFFCAAMLAGGYVGFGILLIFTIGGLLEGAAFAKIIMGASFGIALSLVMMAGSELFTGSNMNMAFGVWNQTVTIPQALRLWLVCWLGNLAGSWVIALLFWASGYATGNVGEFIAHSAMAKMSIPFFPLLLRGMLCNGLVCLAVWCSMKCKSESGKLIMIFWCLFGFITTGFEHSVANMTLLSISLLAPMNEAITFGGYCYNLLVVTLGNILGGVLLIALPYQIAAKPKKA